jgi:hypothetical protein
MSTLRKFPKHLPKFVRRRIIIVLLLDCNNLMLRCLKL